MDAGKDKTKIVFQDKTALDVILQFISDKVKTCLVIGGYDPSNQIEKYPNLNAYLHRLQTKLDKEVVENVFSATSIVHDVGTAVRGLKFFQEPQTLGGDDLFKFTDDNPNLKFVKNSSLVNDKNNCLEIDWDDVKEWIDDQTDAENFLKMLVKTQIYRPLFFRHDNYTTFTSDPSKYTCTTSKSFVDFLGNTVHLEKNGE